MLSSWCLEYLDAFFQLLKKCGDNSGITELADFSSSSFLLTAQQKRFWSFPVAVGTKHSTPLYSPSPHPAHPFLAPQFLQHEGNEVTIHSTSSGLGQWQRTRGAEGKSSGFEMWCVDWSVCFHNLSARHPAPGTETALPGLPLFSCWQEMFFLINFSCCNLRQAAFLQRNNKLLPALLQ